MNKTTKYRGHEIVKRGKHFYFKGTNTKTVGVIDKIPCGHCNLPNTKEGYDGCIGYIPNALNACCGHGIESDAYIQYKDKTIRGKQAIEVFNRLKNI